MANRLLSSRKGMSETLRNMLIALVVIVVLISLIIYFSENFRRSIGCEGAGDMMSFNEKSKCVKAQECPSGTTKGSESIFAIGSWCGDEEVCCVGSPGAFEGEGNKGKGSVTLLTDYFGSKDITGSSMTVNSGDNAGFYVEVSGDVKDCEVRKYNNDGTLHEKIKNKMNTNYTEPR